MVPVTIGLWFPKALTMYLYNRTIKTRRKKGIEIKKENIYGTV